MMYSNFTPAVVRALDAAQQWAARNGSSDVRPEELLLGLLEEQEGRAAVLLTGSGIDPEMVRKALAVPPAATPPAAPAAPLPFAPLAAQSLDQAHDLARQAGADHTVASEHVLLGLLQVAADLRVTLQALGLAFAKLETAILGVQAAPLCLDEPLNIVAPTEEIDSARILDANANRAREAMRVLEDYTRFVLDDAFLSRELKQIRHALTDALDRLPATLLLKARETLRDVGTSFSTAAERRRESFQAVVQANCKRLQEALRSLEEFGKLRSPDVGAALEQLRYRSYTLERALMLGADARQRLADARLYVLLTGSQCHASLDWTIREAAAGGAQIFQLREKNLTDRQLLERARRVRRWTQETGALFIMNDRPDIARLVEADGVHVGQHELPVKEVRRIVAPKALIGVSTHDLSQVRQAVLDGASYIGVGPTFPSGTKEFAEFPGLEFARQAAAETSLPAFVIGGVNLENIDQVVASGLRRVAVSQAICRAEEPRQVAAAMRAVLENK
jgi:thiamine-phosphate pyrophosphorylase